MPHKYFLSNNTFYKHKNERLEDKMHEIHLHHSISRFSWIKCEEETNCKRAGFHFHDDYIQITSAFQILPLQL